MYLHNNIFYGLEIETQEYHSNELKHISLSIICKPSEASHPVLQSTAEPPHDRHDLVDASPFG